MIQLLKRREYSQTRAPGKLILSGEHSVVYGQPALACAIDRYTHASIRKRILPGIVFDLPDLDYQKSLTLWGLKKLKRRAKQKYQAFLKGDALVSDLVKHPFELAQIAVSQLLVPIGSPLRNGIGIRLNSDIPMGVGLGSSAAMIVSIVESLNKLFTLNLSPEHLFEASRNTENFQHGNSSGLDCYLALHGGCHWVSKNGTQSRKLPKDPFHIILTGMPESSTGESVKHAQPFFTPELLNEFSAVTLNMDQALQKDHQSDLLTAVRYNHQLLTQIQVVPKKVAQFITDIEASGGAAKICGAGAAYGEKAGVVWALADPNDIQRISQRYGYSTQTLYGVEHGSLA